MTLSRHSLCVAVTDPTQVGEARRKTNFVADRIGLDETHKGKAALIATEMATNLYKHARDGEIVIRPLTENSPPGLEILSIDRGPGITNLGQSLADGFSTAGSPGSGLGAIRRTADLFDIYSSPKGTVLVSQILPGGAAGSLTVGAVCLPYPGESVCGDAWTMWEQDGRCSLMIADGLGHGVHAAEASQRAVDIFDEVSPAMPVDILQQTHDALRPTRGAAVLVVKMDRHQAMIHCAGIGNISGVILEGAASRSIVSLNGTAGHQARRLQPFEYPWQPQSSVVLYSDGLHSRWKLDDYPGLGSRHPSLVAAVLYRDFRRERDDVTVIVVRKP